MTEQTTLLDACLQAEKVSGGTIHQYLPRLRWAFDAKECNKYWLIYRTTTDAMMVIGVCEGLPHAPEITPDLVSMPGFSLQPHYIKTA